MENDIATRIDTILSEFQLAPSAFADAIQIPRAVMSHILSRRNKPSLEVVQKILKQYTQINTDWLLTGTGTMIQLNLFEEVSVPTTDSLPSKNISRQESIPDINSINTVEPIIKNNEHQFKSETSEVIMPDSKKDSEPIISKIEVANPAPEPLTTVIEKKIEKIIFFYSDKSFSVHFPEFQ